MVQSVLLWWNIRLPADRRAVESCAVKMGLGAESSQASSEVHEKRWESN